MHSVAPFLIVVASMIVPPMLSSRCYNHDFKSLRSMLKTRHSPMAECVSETLLDKSVEIELIELVLQGTLYINRLATIIQYTLFERSFDANTKMSPMSLLLHEINSSMMAKNPSNTSIHFAYNSSLNALFAIDHIWRDTVEKAMRHQCYRTYPEFLQKIEELDRWLKKIACALRNLSVAKEPDQTQAIRLWMSHSATHKLWDTWKCQQLQMHSTCCWRDYYMLQMVVEFMTLTQNQMKHLVNVQP